MALRHSGVEMDGSSSFWMVSVSPVQDLYSEYSEPTIFSSLSRAKIALERDNARPRDRWFMFGVTFNTLAPLQKDLSELLMSKINCA